MKVRKILFFVLILTLLTVSNAFAIHTLNDTVEGTRIITLTHVDTTGSWQAVTLPSTMPDIRHVALLVSDGDSSTYTQLATKVQFWISSESDGTGAYPVYEITLAIGKYASEVLCYIRAATGQKLSILGLY